MSAIDALNRELARLDAALRQGRIDRDSFRARRRQILLDFEERQVTTAPGVGASPRAENLEPTVVDPHQPAAPLSGRAAAPAATIEAAAVPASGPVVSASRPLGLIVTGLGVLIVMGLAGWWLIAKPGPSATPTGSAAPAPAAPMGGDLPQTAAADLMQTEWTDADIEAFLDRWNRMSADALRAAKDDPRIWLLRGETDRRLREANDAHSLDPTPETQLRIRQLERLQSAFRVH